MTLDELAIKHGTDKSSLRHNYANIYEKYVEHLKNDPINFLELGWGGYEDPNAGGESARMWREYFTKAHIKILDIHEKKNDIFDVDFIQGHQESAAIAKNIVEEHGMLDIVIDDASHISSLTIQSFCNYFKALKSGGLYVIEDLHSSYDPSYYGADEADYDPNTSLCTAMSFLKDLCDQVNVDFLNPLYDLKHDIEFIHFYKDICFIKKK